MVLVSGFEVFCPLGFSFVKGEKNSHDILYQIYHIIRSFSSRQTANPGLQKPETR